MYIYDKKGHEKRQKVKNSTNIIMKNVYEYEHIIMNITNSLDWLFATRVVRIFNFPRPARAFCFITMNELCIHYW